MRISKLFIPLITVSAAVLVLVGSELLPSKATTLEEELGPRTGATKDYSGGVLIHPESPDSPFGTVILWKVADSQGFENGHPILDSDQVEQHLKYDPEDVFVPADDKYGQRMLDRFHAALHAGTHFSFDQFGE